MARYDVKLRSSGTYGIFVEGKGFVDIEEVCDLLNAHDGMMTREQVEEKIKETKKTIQSCLELGIVSNVIKFSSYAVGLETVLNGGAK